VLAPTPRGKARRSRTALTAFGIGSLVALTISTPVAASPNGQWYLEALHIRKAQEISTGDGVTVAVIDSGVDSSRPALRGQLTEGKCFGSAEDIEPTWDPNGHGTAMAGLIAGNGEDKRRILGVAPGSKIMPLCVSVEHTTADTTFEDITPAIRYAVDHGAKVVSMSLGALEKRASRVAVANLHAAVSYAERHDVVIVAAAGNAGQINATPSPASLPGVVAVTGTRKGGGLWKDSVPGKHVALAAPAENILTTYTGTVENPQKGPHDTSGYTVSLFHPGGDVLCRSGSGRHRDGGGRVGAGNVAKPLL
jgi:subtilisin family serine protease